jgi:hypothetical protein
MTLDKKAIKEFQEIYREDYGIDLEFSEAEKLATAFAVQMSVLYRPITKDYFNNFKINL